MIKLRPCPFCGQDDAETSYELAEWHQHLYRTSFWIECNCCECRGPNCPTEERAISAWNKRSDPRSGCITRGGEHESRRT
jgi:Lar family restriction alleviation protein